MIDDMHGLYEFASEAHYAGWKTAIENVRRVIGLELSRISVAHETGSSVDAFRVAEECSKALREGLAAIEAAGKITR